MDYSKVDNVKSHPKKLLIDHTKNVYKLGKEIFKRKTLNFNNLIEIEKALSIILLTHDYGKANKYFQIKLANINREDSNKILINKELSNHSLLSALLAYILAEKILDDEILMLICFIIVFRHHSNLNDFSKMFKITENDWRNLEKQFKSIKLNVLDEITQKILGSNLKYSKISFESIKKKVNSFEFREKVRDIKKNKLNDFNYFLINNILFSILIFSDKSEVAFYKKGYSFNDLKKIALNSKELPGDLVDNYRKEKGWLESEKKINIKRNQIYNEIIKEVEKNNFKEDYIFSINTPTGSGKTLAAFSAALKIREKKSKDLKIIYSLPFTSIIDQNYEVFIDVLKNHRLEIDSSIIIKHHYLNKKKYKFNDDQGYNKNEEIIFDYDISRLLIESWESEIVVTTFVQLLHSIFSNQNRSLIKFHNFSDSIIILDEVQNIPHKYWKLIKDFFEIMAKKMNCYFVFLTATMPLIYNEKNGEIKELAANKKDYFNFFNRINLDTSMLSKDMDLEQFMKFIKNEISKFNKDSFLIILNTVKTSIKVYQSLRKLKENGFIKGELIYISTNVIPKDRLKRIEKIKKEDGRKIIVTTPIVEAGIDIDLDRVYRELTTIDSLNQSGGRANREYSSNKKGNLIIFKLTNKKDNNKLYASYIYDNVLLDISYSILRKKPNIIEEKQFFEISQEYFKTINFSKSEGITKKIRDDDSNKIIEKIKKLKYKKAFYKDEEDDVFNLIVNNYETVNLFISLNKESELIWEEYNKIRNIEVNKVEDLMRKKARFEEIKNDFLSTIITIPKKSAEYYLNEQELKDEFNYISESKVKDLYNKETGFKRKIDEIHLPF